MDEVFAVAQRDGETTSHEEESEELEPARQVTHWQCLKDRKQMMDCCVCNRMEGKGWQAGNTLLWMGEVGGRCWKRQENPPAELPFEKHYSFLFSCLVAVLMEFLGSGHPQSGMEGNGGMGWENGTEESGDKEMRTLSCGT